MKRSIACALTLVISATAPGAHAQDMLGNVAEASGDTVVATGRLAEASVKLVAGVASLPFRFVGWMTESAGAGIRQSADAVWESANGPLAIRSDDYDRRDDREGREGQAQRPSRPGAHPSWDSGPDDW